MKPDVIKYDACVSFFSWHNANPLNKGNFYNAMVYAFKISL